MELGMKRYYVCKIIGTGLTAFPTDARRPAIDDIVDPVRLTRAFVVADHWGTNADGTPKLPWCIVIASGPNHALAANVPDVDQLPDVALDAKISTIDTQVKGAILARLTARGIDTTVLRNSDSFRVLINLLGRLHEADFDVNNFDVQDS